MNVGPTSGAKDRAWAPRPGRAFLVRSVVALGPIVVSFGLIRFVAPALAQGPGRWGVVLFVAQGAVVGTVAAHLTQRATRRLLPLVSLLNMTLVFPDRAPSRFGLALRSGTIKQLKGALDSAISPVVHDHQQAAEQMVAMVAELGRHGPRHRQTGRASGDPERLWSTQ